MVIHDTECPYWHQVSLNNAHSGMCQCVKKVLQLELFAIEVSLSLMFNTNILFFLILTNHQIRHNTQVKWAHWAVSLMITDGYI